MRGQMFNFSQNRMVADATIELGAAFAQVPVQLAETAARTRDARILRAVRGLFRRTLCPGARCGFRVRFDRVDAAAHQRGQGKHPHDDRAA